MFSVRKCSRGAPDHDPRRVRRRVLYLHGANGGICGVRRCAEDAEHLKKMKGSVGFDASLIALAHHAGAFLICVAKLTRPLRS
jgi:hypothetical protein